MQQQLKQTTLALHNYESSHKRFPSHQMGSGDLGCCGGTQRAVYSGWHALLPYLEQTNLYGQLEALPHVTPWADNPSGKSLLIASRLSFLECPSDAGETDPSRPQRTNTLSSYAFCTGDNYASSQVAPMERTNAALRAQKLPIRNRGVFGRFNFPKIGEITDGTSNTLALGERQRPVSLENIGMVTAAVGDINTMVPLVCRATAAGKRYLDPTSIPRGDNAPGYRGFGGNVYFAAFTTILPPNAASCLIAEGGVSYHLVNGIWSSGSEHTGGANFSYADGSVHFISDSIDTGNLSVVAPAINTGGPSPYGVWGALGTKSSGEAVPLPE